jgi:hypothetical protein
LTASRSFAIAASATGAEPAALRVTASTNAINALNEINLRI